MFYGFYDDESDSADYQISLKGYCGEKEFVIQGPYLAHEDLPEPSLEGIFYYFETKDVENLVKNSDCIYLFIEDTQSPHENNTEEYLIYGKDGEE